MSAIEAVRQSVSLPKHLATQVRSMAKSRRVSANRILVELIENGIQAEQQKEKAFFELKNAQAIVAAFDGVSPMPATYCYLKPDFLPATMTWFEQERMGFELPEVRS